MKKNKSIQLLNPQLFVKDYFNHGLMEEDRFDINEIAPREGTCFFLIASIEAGTKYLKVPQDNIKLSYYEFLFLTEGFCHCTDNLNELRQEKNQLRFVAPGKITSIKEISTDARGYYCLFDKAFIDTYSGQNNYLNSLPFFDLDSIPVISITQRQTLFFEILFSKMEEDFSTDFFNKKSSICAYLVAILKECCFFYNKILQSNARLTSADRIAQEFLRLVNKYYLSKRQLSEYATLLNVTPKHLTKCVKAATGDTPMNFIHRMILLDAKVLLRNTDQTIAEVAYQLSFDDAAYFNRFFKKHTNITPVQFRNKD